MTCTRSIHTGSGHIKEYLFSVALADWSNLIKSFDIDNLTDQGEISRFTIGDSISA